MIDLLEPTELVSLTGQLDDISTRLIIDGVSAVGVTDFQALHHLAQEMNHQEVAAIARRITDAVAGPVSLSIPDLTRLFSAGIEEMRHALEQQQDGVAPPALATVIPSSAAIPEGAEAVLDANALAADEDLIRGCLAESMEHIVAIEREMLLLEKDHSVTEPLNAVFRAFHTIKGIAGFMQFGAIQSLAHEIETLLDLARKGQMVVTPSIVDLVLEVNDTLRNECVLIEHNLPKLPSSASNTNLLLLDKIHIAAHGEPPASSELDLPVSKPSEAAVSQQTGAPLAAPRQEAVMPTVEVSKAADPGTVRIDTLKLDQLMDMVGEMVIAQTLIAHSPALSSLRDTRLLADLTQLRRITSDVQRITAGMRMVPIGVQFQKTARLVRDLSRRAGKHIVLESSGEDTELDKTIAEELSDPLMHMVRNSIDHGIESPEERTAAGKDPTARVHISAYHQSGQIVVAISDDGRGLNREKILAKAQENGLIGTGDQLTDNDIFHLIFEPGFSTADKVTDISGRGVGMDVVRRHVQKLRGRIEIQSKPGQGTTFFLKLPLTLAIIEGLVIVVGSHRYIVPIFSVKEMFRPTQDILHTVQGKGEMVMVRGGLLPIVRLHQHFAIDTQVTNLSAGTLIVAESEGRQFCLFVDDLIGRQQVVIKSLGESFKDVAGIAGCAILGDGRVGLILDTDGIYKGRA